MSWVNPDLIARQAEAAHRFSSHPVVRERVRSVEVDPRSGYNPSIRTHGLCEVIQLQRGEKMADRMGAAFFNLRLDLEKAGVTEINEPEIFPIDEKQALVLMTGWKKETIILSI